MRRLILALLLLALSAATAWAEPITVDVNEKVYDVVLHLASPAQFAALRPLQLTVVDRVGDDYRLMASEDEIAYLEARGYAVEVLGRADGAPAAGYRTYPTVLSDLESIAAAHPDTTQLIDIGKSAGGKRMVALKISQNAAESAAKPALLFDGTIHGDEAIGEELCFAFINYLLSNYGSDATVTSLVNDNEIFVVPVVNPDGFLKFRGNGDGADLNRSFAFTWQGFDPWTPEPEVTAMMNLVRQERPMYYINYHSGSQVVNYTWDGVYTLSPENDLEIKMSHVYADPSGYDITNGAAWYIADGTAEDWVHGTDGAITVIVELSTIKMPAQGNWPAIFNRNIPAMVAWAQQTNRGVRGAVTDAVTGAPLEAVIVADGRLPVTSDPVLGDYYRLLPAGPQKLFVWANGYGWNEVDVVVPANDYTVQDIALTPQPGTPFAAIRCAWSVRKDASDNPPNVSWPVNALGGHDGVAFSTGVSGYAVFDMGENTPVVDGPGNELTVYEKGNDDGYSVLVGQDWGGPFKPIGQATGTASFDISSSGFSQIRYVLIRDDGDGANNNPTPGVDIDAIEYTPVCEAPAADFSADPTSGPAPLTVTFTNQVQATAGCLSGLSWDFGDGATSTQPNPQHKYTQPGAYTVMLTATGPGGQDVRTRQDYIEVTNAVNDDDVSDDDATDDDATDDDHAGDDAAGDDSSGGGSGGCGC